MRILYFTRDYTPHDHRFLAALAQTSHQVYFLRLERRSLQLEDRALPPGIQQVPWRGGRKPAFRQEALALWLDLKRVIRLVKPDLIHAGPVQTAGLLAALSGFRPLVTMSWGSDLLRDADRSRGWRWATRATLGKTDVLLGDCEVVRQKAVEFGFPAKKVVLFPWGVDLAHFSPGEKHNDLRSRLGWAQAFTLLSTRSWEPVYGVDVVARAFVQAAQDLPELRLFMLAAGSQASLLHRILETGDVLDRVHLGGQVNYATLPHYYHAADLYLSASHSDGSSISLLEALACGLPAAVSAIPGNREWIGEGQQGWLFPDGDAGALADRIRQAAAQPARLAEMGRSARTLAEQRADWKVNFKCLLQAYEMAIDSRQG